MSHAFLLKWALPSGFGTTAILFGFLRPIPLHALPDGTRALRQIGLVLFDSRGLVCGTFDGALNRLVDILLDRAPHLPQWTGASSPGFLKRHLSRGFMTRSFALLLFMPAVLSAFALGQYDTATFCNAGLNPDGYIDFTDLPPAPSFPGNSTPPAATTETVPVHGIAGLSVQVTIPPFLVNSTGPIYTVNNGILVFNTFPESATVQLQFSQPVAGVGIVGISPGRDGSFAISTTVPGVTMPPTNYSSGSSIHTLEPNFLGTPTQQVAIRGSSFILATITVGGGDFGSPSLGNLRVQSTTASAASLVPTNGLQLWLKSESVGSQFAGGAASWPDQSGNSHDATQTVLANQPGQIQSDGNTCLGAFSFGQNQFFNFNLPIDGWKEMTIFMVGKSLVDASAVSGPSTSAGIFWNENAFWGNSFLSPYQNSVSFRFGTSQAGNQPIYTRPLTVGQDFTITRAEHNWSVESLYVNGLLALRQANKNPVLSGTDGTGFIGRGVNGTYYNGEISEILVYDRVLLQDEAASVESYLRNKFGTR
jgi:Concanavalin A-like lectin/glucanases superfamily